MLFPFPLPCSLFNVMAENSMVVLNAWGWGMAFLCLLLVYILVSCFGWCASPFIDLEWQESVSYKGYLTSPCLVLTCPGLELSTVDFFFIPYSFRNFLKKFVNFSQPDELVGNWFNWFSTTAGMTLLAMRDTWPCFVWFSLVQAHNWAPLFLFGFLFI